MISASSFWILFADVLNCFPLEDLDDRSWALRADPEACEVSSEPDPVEDDPLREDIFGQAEREVWLTGGRRMRDGEFYLKKQHRWFHFRRSSRWKAEAKVGLGIWT